MATFTLNPQALSSGTLVQVPAAGVVIPANAHTATIQLLVPSLAERQNSSQHVDYGVELLIAPSTTWKAWLMAGWDGSTSLDTGKNSTVINPPGAATLGGDFFAAFAGQRARLRAIATEPITLGATITVI